MSSTPRALITGAAGVIGRAAAKRLAVQGFELVLADRDPGALVALARTLPGAATVCADAAEPDGVAAIFAAAGPDLDAVVLAVGAEGPIGPIETCPDEAFHAVMASNVTSVWLSLKQAVKVMKPRGAGSIVVLASVSATMGAPMMSAYAASKHAVLGLVRSSARETAAAGLRINAVCPGPVASDMMQRIDRVQGRLDAAKSIPMQRYADPADVAEMIGFLCSDASRYSTGSSFMVDGGYACR